MQIYTIQIAKWRRAAAIHVPLLDITVKSGEPLFAPDRFLLYAYKQGRIDEEQYRQQYLEKMRESLRSFWYRWEQVASMPVVALACYCRAGEFCHRHLLTECFCRYCHKRSIPFEYLGEIL
ncbi:hypothetical protein ACLPJK_25710 [Pseudomonas aeruginosa]|uniref:DUF488 family protein, N3 subclade n=1 Tax=Pseudomonas aeruginosa TaxID=287 RepID=UPI003D2965D9